MRPKQVRTAARSVQAGGVVGVGAGDVSASRTRKRKEPVGGAEEVRDGRRRNEWTGEGEEEMQHELTVPAASWQRKERRDTIMEREVVDAVKLRMSTMTDPKK